MSRKARRVVIASLVGTSLEWYDFFLYGLAAALIFKKLFFPTFDPLAGTLASLATYAVGFVARPIGGAIFGHFGDTIGRKNILIFTLVLMGASTFAIGLLPTYDSIGVAAPILLVALRFLQGLGLGGEWGGAVLMSIEHSHEGRRGLAASWPQVGAPAGNLLAAGVLGVLSAAMPDEAFHRWGWRLPFLLSAALIVVGLWIRRSISESPLFLEARQKHDVPEMPLLEVLRQHPRELLVVLGARIGSDVCYYIFALFIVTYATQHAGLPREVALHAVLIGSAFQLVFMPLFGALSDRYGRRPISIAGAIGAAAWGFVFFHLLDTKKAVLLFAAAVIGLFFHAAMYGPQAAFVSELFSTRLRYSGASLSYQAAGILGGALAPMIALALLTYFGTSLAVSLYLLGALVINIAAMLAAPETRHADLLKN
ncbi:MHS family MFS transporter [Pendulispora rubella]|uniref:MHS family MFS transporter n=1 Tax=Pendulispora rubella TaxID=2741070 RepID=A0ABZ2LD23_9BACT